jgi:AraC family transcriptional regulator
VGGVRLDTAPEVVAWGAGVHGVVATTEQWYLPTLTSVHLYDWSGLLEVDGATHRVEPGCLSVIPAGARMTFRYPGRSEHLFAHLRMPAGAPTSWVPVVQQLGPRGAEVRERLRVLTAATHPAQRSAELWSLLWSVSSTAPAGLGETAATMHPVMTVVLTHVEQHLADPLTVDGLARVGAVSTGHLRRLAHEALGQSMSAYVRSRRQVLAAHLLRDTTLPIRSVAASVGVHDLQAFNKVARGWWGVSPRAYRTGAGDRPDGDPVRGGAARRGSRPGRRPG